MKNKYSASTWVSLNSRQTTAKAFEINGLIRLVYRTDKFGGAELSPAANGRFLKPIQRVVVGRTASTPFRIRFSIKIKPRNTTPHARLAQTHLPDTNDRPTNLLRQHPHDRRGDDDRLLC